MPTGKAVIFSAPSGSGKTTIVKYLLSKNPKLSFSISATSRPKRGQELEGSDYYFLSPEEFKNNIDKNEFIEWEEVYTGNFYGTLESEIQRIWDKGNHVIFDVDVIGGLNIKKHFKERAISIFVKIPDLVTLEKRLRERGTEAEDKIRQRLEKARHEISFAEEFDVILENNNLKDTFLNAEEIVNRFINT